MRVFALSFLFLLASCNQTTIAGQLFDKIWELSTIAGQPPIACRNPNRLLFIDNGTNYTVQVWPLCVQYNVEVYDLTIDGDVITFNGWDFVVTTITQTTLLLEINGVEFRYYSR